MYQIVPVLAAKTLVQAHWECSIVAQELLSTFEICPSNAALFKMHKTTGCIQNDARIKVGQDLIDLARYARTWLLLEF
jgi:sulfur relay (sulfurtransferase) DsrC/TusE family protein